METFQWQGQSHHDWPRWLTFKNYARTGAKLAIHQFEGLVTLELGDWLDKAPDGFLSVRKPEIPCDGRQSRHLPL